MVELEKIEIKTEQKTQKVGVKFNSLQHKIKGYLEDAEEAEEPEMREEMLDLASIYSESAAYAEATLKDFMRTKDEIEGIKRTLRRDVVKATATLDAIEDRIEIEKMRITVAEARTDVLEHITGLKKNGTSLYEAMNNLTEMREDKEASADALQEMKDSGLLPSVMEEVFEPTKDRADEILAQLRAEVERDEEEIDLEGFETLTPYEKEARLKKFAKVAVT
jgi:hypothetical protein